MFKRFFGHNQEDEEVYEAVDPVLEQRRKEKFSAPLIYNDEEDEAKVEVKKEEKKPEPKKTIPTESTYRMSQIISPMTGLKETKKVETKVVKPKVKKVKKESDDLIPIISPFYGPEESRVEQEKPKKKAKENVTEQKVVPSVEENLRNIAHIVEEEHDKLKIIEERTGEFKLDLKSQGEDSFIDEIDDSMSLDELMSLYEKKFKD